MGQKLGELRGRKGKSDYQHDDFYRIRILKYLSDHEEARLTDLLTEKKYGIVGKRTAIRLLGEMKDDGWINKTISPDAKNVKKYSLTDKGQQMRDFIRELPENHPLFDCKLFNGIKSLD